MRTTEITDITKVYQPKKAYTVALLGNPNSGKSSIFNRLTGMRQKVGNFPGVTVDKKSARFQLSNDITVNFIDFPGTYSLFPTSQDERVVVNVLTNPLDPDYPDAILYIVDSTQLEKHLLLLHQLKDLGIPVLVALNMADTLEKEQIIIDVEQLARRIGVPMVTVSGRTGEGMNLLKNALAEFLSTSSDSWKNAYRLSDKEQKLIEALKEHFVFTSDYQALLWAHHHQRLPFLQTEEKNQIAAITANHQFVPLESEVRETMQRFDLFSPIVQQVIQKANLSQSTDFSLRVDRWVTHPVVGPLLFLGIMMLVFNAIFTWATYPMDWIEAGFGVLNGWVISLLGVNWFSDLLTNGVLTGLSSILVFVPQIAILFFLIAIMEEVGYLSRAVYLFDNLMRRFGLNGRSVVALISGGACAIPAIMSTRTIGNWKERLITIFVTPFISCSARIPVYIVLVGLIVPANAYWLGFKLQSWIFMGLYALGVVVALLAAYVMKKVLKTDEQSYLLLTMPVYRPPVMRNVWMTVYEKTKTFAVEAGQVIFVISIILWVLNSYGPGQQMETAAATAVEEAKELQLGEEATQFYVASKELEASYAGHFGKFIEPVIQPLGYDWKIGIALISSFAAREVFVGTMGIIFNMGDESDEFSLRDRLANNPLTGEQEYSFATIVSLLLFYVFAMQCMATLAVTKRETKSWMWAILQLVVMTSLAYLVSFGAYQLLA